MKFEATIKALDIETNARVIYLEIAILLIMYYSGWGKTKTISLLKIHLLLWTLKDSNRQQDLLFSLENDFNESIGFWTIDIKNNSILTFMIKDKICEFNNKSKKYSLTESGLEFVQNIIKLDIMKSEQEFLKRIGKKLTDDNVEKLKSLWS